VIATGPCHLVAVAGDRRSLCGVKDPLPVVLASRVQAHIDGYGLEVCDLCDLANRQGATQ
jgi:hypothetical protein